MKFKIEKKDLIIFGIYAVVLFYLCIILVLNFASFADTGEFHGLSPFGALNATYFPVIILLFVCLMVLIFTSVSSYIFNKEKGMGIGLKIGGKGSDGYVRWATAKEIKKQKDLVHVTSLDKDVEAAGIPIISNNKGFHVDNGGYHNLVIGSTGSGKTETLVKPMVNLLARKGESMIITDPKGEIYKYTLENLKSKGYNIILLNFREPQRGNSWNPLSLPYAYHKEGNKDKSTELLNDVAVNIFYDNQSKDPFWEKTSADYFVGITMGLFEDAKEEEINLNSINYFSTVGEEKYAANSTFIKEYFQIKGESSRPYIFASSTIGAPNETKGSILSTYRQKIRIFSATENLSEMLAKSDFDMRDIGKKKTAVFLVIHDEKKTYHSLMTIFIKQCYESLIDVAQENGGKLEYRTNFILDEFANMPALKDVDAMVSAARSRAIRFTFIIQNFAQLNDVYGDNIAEVIKGNCGNLIYLISTEMKALEEISKMCGEVKSKDKEKTSSTPLITVSDLQKLKLFEAVIIRIRSNPFKTQLKPNFKINWGEQYPLGDYPHREYEEPKLFDIKKFVMEEKRKKQMENGGNAAPGGFTPFSNQMPGSNPFQNNANPFQNNMPGSNPFQNNANPFQNNMPGSNPFQNNANPFQNNMSGNSANNGQSNANVNNNFKPFADMDIDAMLKDIDEKIKEFEDKEKNENAKVEEKKKDVKKKSDTKKPETNKIKEENVEDKEENIVKSKIVVDTASKIVEPTNISDDEFYDDFFDE